MWSPAKICIVALLTGGVVAVATVTWPQAGPQKTPDAPAADPKPGAPAPEPEAVDPDSCYSGEWLGCWRYVNDPTQQRFIRLSEDGCTMTQPGLEGTLHMVYGFTTTERESIGPEEASFAAPRGSVVFYAVPTNMGFDNDPVRAINTRRGEDGRVPDSSGVYAGWMVLSKRFDGQRTMAMVSRITNSLLEVQPPPPEIPLARMECPEE